MTVLRLLIVVASSADTPKSAAHIERNRDSVSKHRIDQCPKRILAHVIVAAAVLCADPVCSLHHD